MGLLTKGDRVYSIDSLSKVGSRVLDRGLVLAVIESPLGHRRSLHRRMQRSLQSPKTRLDLCQVSLWQPW